MRYLRAHDGVYHLVKEDRALCGAVKIGDNGAIASDTDPADDPALCEICRQRAAVMTVQRVSAKNPFNG